MPSKKRDYQRGPHMYLSRWGVWYAYIPGRKQISLRTPNRELATARFRGLVAGAGLDALPIGRTPRNEVVYFVRCGVGGPIKIGRTTALMARARSIQANAPGSIHIVAAIMGSADLEAALHRRFDSHRLNGEWFAAAPVLEFLAGLSEVAVRSLAVDVATPANDHAQRTA